MTELGTKRRKKSRQFKLTNVNPKFGGDLPPPFNYRDVDERW
jgi:hypothetical protein